MSGHTQCSCEVGITGRPEPFRDTTTRAQADACNSTPHVGVHLASTQWLSGNDTADVRCDSSFPLLVHYQSTCPLGAVRRTAEWHVAKSASTTTRGTWQAGTHLLVEDGAPHCRVVGVARYDDHL